MRSLFWNVLPTIKQLLKKFDQTVLPTIKQLKKQKDKCIKMRYLCTRLGKVWKQTIKQEKNINKKKGWNNYFM